MAPRTRVTALTTKLSSRIGSQYVCQQCRSASMAAATTPAASQRQIHHPERASVRYPPTQPPSHKPIEFRKSQLHRQYQSLLRSSPLVLILQHNNLKSLEWVSIHRELSTALRKVDEELAKTGSDEGVGRSAKLQVVQSGIFASALRVVEFWTPRSDALSAGELTHGLSVDAWKAGRSSKRKHGLEALLSGPIAVLAIPSVSAQHLKAALSILAPSKAIPAPKRKSAPGYHEPAVQTGLQKLMILGARMEGRAFDIEGARWVAGIDGGLDGLRAQLVAMLQISASSLTSTLEAASRNLYLTMEARKIMLEEGDKQQ